MSDTQTKCEGVWFVYDGDCPVCSSAAQALRIKRHYGFLHLLDARTAVNHTLLKEINRRQYDLDDGMVIYCEGQFFHGPSALRFMAKYGDAKGSFNLFNKTLFWSDSLAKLIYPWMRGTRNWILRRKRIGKLDNLDNKSQPTFKSVFGDDWDNLPPVIRKHYANRPYSDDVATVEGVLDVFCAGPVRFLKPLFLLVGTVPPYSQKDVPVRVDFESNKTNKEFRFNRTFHFHGRKPYCFGSRMLQIQGNELVEMMGFGIGWRMDFLWQDGKVILQHAGYVLKLFGHFVPLPITFILGKGYAEEIPVDDDHFDMFVEMTHPLFGKFYGYKGRFKVTKEVASK